MTWQEFQTGTGRMWESSDERWRITKVGHGDFDVLERVDRHTITVRQRNLASLDAAIEWIGGKDD